METKRLDVNTLNTMACDLERAAKNARARGHNTFAAEYEAEAKAIRVQIRESVSKLAAGGR